MTTTPPLDGNGAPVFEVQLQAVLEGIDGNGVVPGQSNEFAVTDGSGDLEVDVATGAAVYDGVDAAHGSPTTLTHAGGDPSDDRWDIVVFDVGTGAPTIKQGTAAATPTPPSIGTDEVLLALVYIQAGATDFGPGDIYPWRVPVGGLAIADDGTPVQPIATGIDFADGLRASSSGSAVTVNADLSSRLTISSGNIDLATDGVGTGALDESITPTWTGSHTFDSGLTVTDPVTLDSSMFGTGLASTEAAIKLPDFGAGGGTLGLLSNTALPSSPPASATLQVGDFILGPGGSPLVSRRMSVQTDSNGAVSGTDYSVFSDSIALSGNVSVSGTLEVDKDLTLKNDLADSAGNVVYSDANKEVLQGRLGGPAGKLNAYPLDRHTDYNPTFNTVSVASDYTIQDEDDVILVDTSSSAITLDTPTANNPPDGARHIIIDTGGNASSNPITVDPDIGIDNVTSTTIDTDYGALVMVYNDSSWWTAGGGSGGGASGSGVTDETIVADESGSVGNGNLGTIVATEVPDGGSIEITQGSLLLADGQPAPSGCDLILATLDGTGGRDESDDAHLRRRLDRLPGPDRLPARVVQQLVGLGTDSRARGG